MFDITINKGGYIMKTKRIIASLLFFVFLGSSTFVFAAELQYENAGLIHEYPSSNFYMEKHVIDETMRVPNSNLSKKTSSKDGRPIEKNIIIIVPGLYKYDITTENEGYYYFPNQPFETITNYTTDPMYINDTFSTEASVKLSGSIRCESDAEDLIEAEFGFNYDYSNTFSRLIKTTLRSNYALRVFVEYQKIVITEKEYIYSPDPGYSSLSEGDITPEGYYKYNKTRTKTVYKPVGLTYVSVPLR